MLFAPVVFASLIVSASALATPHIPNGLNRRSHASLAHVRAADPAPVVASAAVPKREIVKRCKARPTSAITRASPSATAAPSSSVAPQNVVPFPVSVSIPISIPVAVPSVSVVVPHPPPKHSHPPSSSPSPSPSHSPKPDPPAPKPSSPASPSPPSGGSSSDPYSGSHSGDGTFYATGLGACGITNTDSQFIVAISESLFDGAPNYDGGNPNKNPLCGKKLNVNYMGKQITVVVTDRCTGCSEFSIDFSPAAFNTLADPSIGRLHNVEWSWA